jgi:hypothetical protein
MHFSHKIKRVIKFNVNGPRIAIGICYDHRDITHVTDIGRFITGERRITRITRGDADEVSCIFLAVLNTVTVRVIIYTGIIASYAEAALTYINLRAVDAVITECTIDSGLDNTLI